jgi:hypothetical protein
MSKQKTMHQSGFNDEGEKYILLPTNLTFICNWHAKQFWRKDQTWSSITLHATLLAFKLIDIVRSKEVSIQLLSIIFNLIKCC